MENEKKELEKRIKELEEKVAELEGLVQGQPDNENTKENLAIWFKLLSYLNSNEHYKNFSSFHKHQVQIIIRRQLKSELNICNINKLEIQHLDAMKQIAEKTINDFISSQHYLKHALNP